jgi:CRISPR system Cascade subunit CasD
LAVPKAALSTILSTRDYRQNAASLVAMQPRTLHPQPCELHALAAALREPLFTLCLGRKSCPPAAPLWPQVIATDSALAAFAEYAKLHDPARQSAADKRSRLPLEALPPLTRIAFDDYINAGVGHDLSTRRKDRLIRRKGWQFGDRTEHIALITPET